MLRAFLQSGRVVLASGCPMAMSFLALYLFPSDILRSVGVGCCIALCLTMLVNLTLTPALLLLFPRFFSNFKPLCTVSRVSMRQCCGERCLDAMQWLIPSMCLRCDSGGGDVGDDDEDGEEHPTSAALLTDSPSDALSVREREREMEREREGGEGPSSSSSADKKARSSSSFWYRSALRVTTAPWALALLLGVLAVCVPVGLQGLKMNTSIDYTLVAPQVSLTLLLLSYFSLCMYLSIYLSIYLSMYLSIYLSFYLSISLCVSVFVFLS